MANNGKEAMCIHISRIKNTSGSGFKEASVMITDLERPVPSGPVLLHPA